MKYKIYLGLIVLGFNTIAQQNPTGNPPSPNNPANNANSAWYRGGNFPVGTSPLATNNIFGTLWNSPIYTKTDGTTRTRLNGTLTTPIFGVNQPVSGYFGIDPSGYFNTNSPMSMLHLHSSNVPVFTTGWRRWMKTGMLVEENSDAMYVGLKTEAASNQSDAIINWSDDAAGGGPDKLRFIFTESTPTGNGVGTNPRDGKSLNGYEFMRMQNIPQITNTAGFPIGHVGIGPMFTNALRPANRLHINAEDNLLTFIQVSNSSGTGQTGNDGLHFGYPTTSPTFLTAQINQKENDNLVMLTNQGERIRISHIGNISIPTMNPGGIANNITRVSISHNPANPVTRPLSLLHLGYNTGSILSPNNTDGWRPWMDVGMFVAQSSDNVYLGLKNESTTPAGDKYDAVLSWGDNQVNSGLPPNNGPDNFRFIFTSSTTGSAGGTAPATGADGLEGMRLTPTTANGVFTGIGGAPTVNPYSGGLNAGNTAEINSWGVTSAPGGSSGLRFTNLNTTSPVLAANPGPGVLAVDANGDVVYVPGSSGTSLGNICGAATPNPLSNSWEIPLNNNSYIFSGQAANDNVGVGTTCAPVAKFQVQDNSGAIAPTVIGYKATSAFVTTHSNGLSASVVGFNASTVFNSTASYFQGNPVNKVHAIIVPQNGGFVGLGTTSPAVQLHVNGSGGVQIDNGNLNVNGASTNLSNPGLAALNIAGNVGIFGDITGSGANTYVSDVQFKTNIDTITNANNIIKQLKPKTYYFDTTDVHGFDFDSKKQYGFIAQDIETILPELVHNNVKDAVLDSTGAIVNPATTFKSLNYNALFAILVRGMQQQQTKIDSLTSKLNSKDSIQDARLTALENAITQCCSSAATRNNNSSLNQLDVELSDKDAIVLEQNVPNPFAEQTTINYNVPASVGKAQIIFFNTNGQVIQTVDIKTRGKGKVNVFASDLSSGLYNYTLVADGKVIDSKKMVRE